MCTSETTNHSIFSQHGNHGRRPPRPLPPPIVLRRPFRHDRPLPHSNYNVGYARFFMISSGGPGKTKFVSNHIFKGRIKNIHDNQMGFSAAPRDPAPISKSVVNRLYGIVCTYHTGCGCAKLCAVRNARSGPPSLP